MLSLNEPPASAVLSKRAELDGGPAGIYTQHKTGAGCQATSYPQLHLFKVPKSRLSVRFDQDELQGWKLEVKSRSQKGHTADPHTKIKGSIPCTLSPSHPTVGLLLLKLPRQYLMRRQESHSDVEEDLPEVPQPVQVHVAQANEEQHQHHLRSPGWTVEQVQITLK